MWVRDGHKTTFDDLLGRAVFDTSKFKDDRQYKIDLLLGSSRRWRSYAGGKFEDVTDPKPIDESIGDILQSQGVELTHKNGDRKVKYRRHVPRLHKGLGPFEGSLVKGLIQEAIEWREASSGRVPTPNGQESRMVLLTNIEDAGEWHPPLANTLTIGMLKEVGESIGLAIAKAIRK